MKIEKMTSRIKMNTQIDLHFDAAELIHVIQLFNENKFPKDDTMLEKLVSELETLTETRDISSSGALRSIVEGVVQNAEIVPHCFAAVTRIVGALCHTVQDSHGPFCVHLLKKCCSSNYCDDASVNCAFLFVLLRIVALDSCSTAWVVDQGFLQEIVKCLEKRSLFVKKAAKKVLASLIAKSLPYLIGGKENMLTSGEELYQSLQSIKQLLFDMLDSLTGKKVNPINKSHCVDIFLLLFENGNKDTLPLLCNVYGEHRNILEAFCDTLEDPSFENHPAILNIFTAVQKISPSYELPQQRLEDICCCLDGRSKPKKAVALATWTLQSFNEETVTSSEDFILKKLSCMISAYPTVDHRLFLRCLTGVSHFRRKNSDAIELLCSVLSDKSPIQTLLSENSKLLHACIASLHTLIQFERITKEDVNQVKTCSLYLLADTCKTYQVTAKVLQLVVSILSIIPSKGCMEAKELDNYLMHIAEHIPVKLMHIQWEIRDSALQFLADLAILARDNTTIERWLSEKEFISYVWIGLADGESYVRAASVRTLTVFLQHPSTEHVVWEALDRDETFDKLHDIVRFDTEAFARRAVVELYSTLYFLASCTIHQSESDKICEADAILNILSDIIRDFDWQVKLQVLEFWEKFVKKQSPANDTESILSEKDDFQSQTVPEYACDLIPIKINQGFSSSRSVTKKQPLTLDTLCKVKIPQVLLSALYDHDKVVCLKACDLFDLILKHVASENEANLKRSKIDTETMLLNLQAKHDVFSADEFTTLLYCIDVENIRRKADMSDDQYANNPRSLISDLLIAMGAEKEDGDDDNAEDNAASVDCY